MRTALDTNIPSTLLTQQPSMQVVTMRLDDARREGDLYLSPFSYSELFAIPKMTESLLSHFLARTGIEVDSSLQQEVWREAGVRYALMADRRRRGASRDQPRRIVADFFIGAHALHHADRLMTLDVQFYKTNFPELALYPLQPAV